MNNDSTLFELKMPRHIVIDWHCKNVKILLFSKYSLSFTQWRSAVPSVLSVTSCFGDTGSHGTNIATQLPWPLASA